ncbi:MAG TPA: polysaccharide pyruvyl transferase family protein [Acidimicrobiales bacterium]|jgi:polysaccharide pyruvyl transferase WcaK-like protein|nr:polysaccharide pyruvyl transferase family protein [Acidimicrobiales bacterium]
MPVVLLAGAFGQGNLGDEALLRAFVQALPDWRVTVTTDDPASAEELGCGPVPSRRAAVARAASSADAVVVGGGTMFKTLHPASARRPHALLVNAAALVGLSSALRRPVALVGVGAGSLGERRSRRLSRFVVRHADLLILRDEESAAELSRAGASGPFRVGADPAWTLLEPPDARSVHDRSVLIAPSIFAAGADGWGGMIERLAETVRRLLAAGVEVRVQPWQLAPRGATVDDGTIAAALVARFGGSIDLLPKPATIGAAAQSMVGTGTVLSFRFHALVAAAAAGVPTVAVVHESKLGAMARRLEQRAAPVDFEPGALATQVLHAVDAPGPPPAVIKEQIGLAEEGFRLLRVLLSRGRSLESDTLGALPLAPSPSP